MIEHLLRRELRSLRLELEAYPDERLIWALPAGLPNSAGTLTLHLAGNLRHFVGTILGGTSYVRNRDLEFTTRDLSREMLLAEIADAESAIQLSLSGLTQAQLDEQFPEPIRDHNLDTSDLLLQLAVHLPITLGRRATIGGSSRETFRG